jgi:hypothetical protein
VLPAGVSIDCGVGITGTAMTRSSEPSAVTSTFNWAAAGRAASQQAANAAARRVKVFIG